MKAEYAPKELKILDAAIAIIGESPTSLRGLKVADIASRAGIGKGTVYEYFASKDELISEAICYQTRTSLETEWVSIQAENSFKEGFFHAMDFILKEQAKPSVMNLELMRLDDEGLLKAAMKDMKALFDGRMKEIYGELLNRGAAENLFPPPDSTDYAIQVLISVFSGLDFFFRMGDASSFDEYKENAYAMLMKALQ